MIETSLESYRRKFDQIFSKDTCHPLSRDNPIPSAGHCAIVSVFLHEELGGRIVSTTEQGVSHWLNFVDGQFIDLTGDQFGYPPIRLWRGELSADYRIRRKEDLDDETQQRLEIFKLRFAYLE
jgi:hypothetical protein